jgi:hypothetical protein
MNGPIPIMLIMFSAVAWTVPNRRVSPFAMSSSREPNVACRCSLADLRALGASHRYGSS